MSHARRLMAGLLLSGALGCQTAPPEPLPRTVFRTAVEPDGLTAPLRAHIPAGTRSLTVVAEGDSASLYALGSLQVDGRELLGAALPQTPRRGTFTFVYPCVKGQALPPGPVTLRLRGTQAGPLRVSLLLPREDGARVLHLNLLTVSERGGGGSDAAPPFLAPAKALLGQAGMHLLVDAARALRGADLPSIDALPEPEEALAEPLQRLTARGAGLGGALNVYLVDRLPPGFDGFSLGTPGPPLPQSPFFGVLLRRDPDQSPQAQGWTLAHELAHFLALRHVQDRSPAGLLQEDGLPDTQPGQDNLMERGTLLSPGQRHLLTRSALLRRD